MGAGRARRIRRAVKAAVIACAAVALALAGTLVALHTGSSSHRAGAALPSGATSGRILAQDADGRVVLVDPATDRVVGSAGFGSIAGGMVMAADRRFVTTLRGDLLAVNNVGRLDPTDVPRITGAALLGGPGTFAAGDTAVIVVASSGEQLHTGVISALVLQGGRSVGLGIADEAAGDPQALGAFVSVASPASSRAVPVGGYLGLGDSRVELRDAGQPPRVLATAAQVNTALGQPAGQPVHLNLFPNPAGTAVAVTANPPLGAEHNVGAVIIDRAGRLVAVVPATVGPAEYSWLSWSPDGRSLAYQTGTPGGASVAVWREGGRTLIRTAPDNRAAFGYCLWSPDGSAILCPTSESARDDWDQGAADGGELFAVPAPGTPIVWLPHGPAR
jgi:hypothetical protein